MRSSVKIGETFTNSGCGECVLFATNGDRFMAYIKESEEYVVATGLDYQGNWTWGHYFQDFNEAVKELKK